MFLLLVFVVYGLVIFPCPPLPEQFALLFTIADTIAAGPPRQTPGLLSSDPPGSLLLLLRSLFLISKDPAHRRIRDAV